MVLRFDSLFLVRESGGFERPHIPVPIPRQNPLSEGGVETRRHETAFENSRETKNKNVNGHAISLIRY